jgi:hypothetical protein
VNAGTWQALLCLERLVQALLAAVGVLAEDQPQAPSAVDRHPVQARQRRAIASGVPIPG